MWPFYPKDTSVEPPGHHAEQYHVDLGAWGAVCSQQINS